MEKVERPEADKKKISCKDEFELCYMRHQYVRRASFNPSAEDMWPYRFIIKQQARNTYFTYPGLFSSVGMEVEDVENIARVHLVSYLSLFSIEQMQLKKEQFERIFEHENNYAPFADDYLNKNKANFTEFLKQRMEDLTRVCRQKVRNIKGFPGNEHYVYIGTEEPPTHLNLLREDYEKYGYRKLDIAVFKTVRKRAKANGASVFQFNGHWYVALRYERKNLDISDFTSAGLDPHDSIHNMSPDRLYSDQQSEVFWEQKRSEFNSYDTWERAMLLQDFLDEHQNQSKFRDEVKLARKLLKEIRG